MSNYYPNYSYHQSNGHLPKKDSSIDSKKFEEMKLHWRSRESFIPLQNQSDDFKDFTFIIGKQQFKVHKCLFAEASEVMKVLFTSAFEDSKNNSTEITDIDPEVFKVLMDFVYGNETEFMKKIDGFAFGVYKAAHKYQMKLLQDFCIKTISKKFTSPERAIETYTFAAFYGIQDLKDKCWDVIERDGDIIDMNIILKEAEDVKDVGVFFEQMQYHREALEVIKNQVKEFFIDKSEEEN